MNTARKQQIQELYTRDTPWMKLAEMIETTHKHIHEYQSRIVSCGNVKYTLYSAALMNLQTRQIELVTRTDMRIQNCVIKSTGWYFTN